MATKTKRRRKSRTERGEDLRRAGRAEHLGRGRYRVAAMRGDKVHLAVWAQGKLLRACDCADPCMSPYSGWTDHCAHVHAAIADRDAALAAANTTEERARVLHDRGDAHIRDGSDFYLGNSAPRVHVEDLFRSYTLPLDLSRCTFWAGERGSNADCEEWEATGGECAHVLAARLEMAALGAARPLPRERSGG